MADYAQYGHSDKELNMPWQLERAILCKRYNWQMLPWELDDKDILDVKQPLVLLNLHDIFQKYGTNLEGLTEAEAELAGQVERIREITRAAEG